MRIVLFGAPGVGKGSQAKFLQERRGIAHISTGMILRKAITDDSAVGKIAEQYVHDGKLVPDAVVRKLAEDAIAERDCDRFVLDGYPRTIQQAEWLTEFLERHQAPLEAVVSLVVSDEIIVDRLSKRRVDSVTRENYHLDFKPPPADLPQERLIQRRDDRPEIVLRRLEHYRSVTEPVEGYYRERGMLVEVDAVGSFEAVHDRIMAVVFERVKSS